MISSMFGSDPAIEISFEEKGDVKFLKKYHSRIDEAESSTDNRDILVPVYKDQQAVGGFVDVVLPENVNGFKYESIHCYLIGQTVCPQLGKDYIFMTENFPLASDPGVLNQSTRYTFRFSKPPLERESFYGSIVELRYFVRVVILKAGLMGTKLLAEEDVYVQNPTVPLERKMLKIEMGVEDELKLEFHYSSSALHCHSKLKGHIEFMCGSTKIFQIALEVLRRETVTTGYESEPELVSTTPVGKFVVYDGEVVPRERIPVMIYMSSIPQLTPTMTTKQFSVKYFLNLVLVDSNGERYYKASEILLWRK